MHYQIDDLKLCIMSTTSFKTLYCKTVFVAAAVVVVTMLYLAVQSRVADCCHPVGSVADSHTTMVQTVFGMWFRL